MGLGLSGQGVDVDACFSFLHDTSKGSWYDGKPDWDF